MSTLKPITSLADLTKLNKTTLSGGAVSQEFFYKTTEVEALVAHLTGKPINELNPEQPDWTFQQCGECDFTTIQPASQPSLCCPYCGDGKGEEQWMSKRPARLLDMPEGIDWRKEQADV